MWASWADYRWRTALPKLTDDTADTGLTGRGLLTGLGWGSGVEQLPRGADVGWVPALTNLTLANVRRKYSSLGFCQSIYVLFLYTALFAVQTNSA